jgi:pimeloyl-ACP methyl ester carboxylesterase
MTRPRIRYARSGDVSIAYQAVGDGPLNLVYVPGWISNVELTWEEPSVARFFERLASFSRLILFDKRGTGLSDRDVGFPTLEDRMDDVRAVMDAVGAGRAAVLGMSEGGNMSMLFAATYNRGKLSTRSSPRRHLSARPPGTAVPAPAAFTPRPPRPRKR